MDAGCTLCGVQAGSLGSGRARSAVTRAVRTASISRTYEKKTILIIAAIWTCLVCKLRGGNWLEGGKMGEGQSTDSCIAVKTSAMVAGAQRPRRTVRCITCSVFPKNLRRESKDAACLATPMTQRSLPPSLQTMHPRTCPYVPIVRVQVAPVAARRLEGEFSVSGDRYANVKALRLRLASVKSIQRITKTMKMVAAAKLKGFQNRMFQARPLGDRVGHMVRCPSLSPRRVPAMRQRQRPLEKTDEETGV